MEETLSVTFTLRRRTDGTYYFRKAGHPAQPLIITPETIRQLMREIIAEQLRRAFNFPCVLIEPNDWITMFETGIGTITFRRIG